MIEELKDLVNTSHSEMTESIIRTQIQTAFSGQKFDPAKKNYYFSSDGLWHVFNPYLKIWTKQENVNDLCYLFINSFLNFKIMKIF